MLHVLAHGLVGAVQSCEVLLPPPILQAAAHLAGHVVSGHEAQPVGAAAEVRLQRVVARLGDLLERERQDHVAIHVLLLGQVRICHPPAGRVERSCAGQQALIPHVLERGDELGPLGGQAVHLAGAAGYAVPSGLTRPLELVTQALEDGLGIEGIYLELPLQPAQVLQQRLAHRLVARGGGDQRVSRRQRLGLLLAFGRLSLEQEPARTAI